MYSSLALYFKLARWSKFKSENFIPVVESKPNKLAASAGCAGWGDGPSNALVNLAVAVASSFLPKGSPINLANPFGVSPTNKSLIFLVSFKTESI